MKPTIKAMHSGGAGDCVYALPTLLSYGTAELYLNPSQYMQPKLANALIPLIKAQPYIKTCKLFEREKFDLNLDEFRLISGAGHLPITYAALDPWCRYHNLNEPWLFNIEPNHVNDIIINRTLRYRGYLDYGSIVTKFIDKISFIGAQDEYDNFCSDYGDVAYYATTDLLEAAQIIKGSKIFIGNQSVCYAIAEGMKVPRLLESSIDMPNCQPIGEHGYSDWLDMEDVDIVSKYVSMET